MAEEEEELPEPPSAYSLVTDAGEKKTSKGFSGKGTANYTNGDVYEGVFENGTRQGKGVYKYRRGDVFEGTFENNMKTGLGRMTYKKGGFYHGFFKDNMRDGEGTFQYANGDIYSGLWQNNKRHGNGTYVFNKTKYAFVGDWKQGQILTGVWQLMDGAKFTGNFQNQHPFGEGVWQTSKGTIVGGAYLQQVLPVDSAPPAKPGETPATTTKIYWSTSKIAALEE
mmetsp:Transcript_57556/g.122418  ORF Transcript_57556/g.122418 Transcript_57556/m.122418 type:complete len:224 (-) Transcript_57556:38-709(-)|eukprot:CAMPEP_0206466090 /NCGR_PEP_ID=MMETSP0324_2-20121206/28243_1 /ASSEMBLY_ACC=CAM_ASM_000836 /TAXON_ID=2866 /ORGANISM="Crypthecodinium cohnii, Strain Seligo" /LENGTH=223 /DNA_ID=CAMNT_0053939123 /DNA_START=118 /DNA_END=789 /DNA_ORIENTATION=-